MAGSWSGVIRYVDGTDQCCQSLLGGSLVEDVQAIGAGRHVRDFDGSHLIRYRKIRRSKHDDDGAHGGMNVTENADDAFAPKRDGPASTGRVETDVEDLAVVVGEGVVENRVVIGKVHCGSHRDGEHVRREGLIFLNHLGVTRDDGQDGRRAQRFQPHYDARIILVLAHVRVVGKQQFDVAADGGRVRCAGANQRGEEPQR